MSRAIAIIPARLGSTRLPGKVLLDQTGHPLIWHVWSAVRAASRVERVVIATDSAQVLDAARGFGAECVLTSPDHPNGTSRLDEAASTLGLADDALIVNVQGDEPEVEPDAIDAAADALIAGERHAHGASIGTVAVPFGDGDDPRDPACVKVVRTLDGAALYFSRSLIPFDRDGVRTSDAASKTTPPLLRHVGLYAYRRGFLAQYTRLAPTPLERLEQLEQLRALEHGRRIMVAVRPAARVGIDTPQQYTAFVERWRRRGASGPR